MQQLCLCPAFMISGCSTDAAALYQQLKHDFVEPVLQQHCCSSFVSVFTILFRHAAALPLSCFYDFRLQHRCSSFASTLRTVFEPVLQQHCCSSFVSAFAVLFRDAAALPLSCFYDYRLQHRCSIFASAF